MVDPDGLDAGGREKVEEYSAATTDVQHRRTATKIFDKRLLDAPNGILATTEFI